MGFGSGGLGLALGSSGPSCLYIAVSGFKVVGCESHGRRDRGAFLRFPRRRMV